MLEIKVYERKPLRVEGVAVTAENMAELAVWCGGNIREHEGKPYIKIETYRPKGVRQTMAFVGSVVLRSEEGYKIYNTEALAKAFNEKPRCGKTNGTAGGAPCILDLGHDYGPSTDENVGWTACRSTKEPSSLPYWVSADDLEPPLDCIA